MLPVAILAGGLGTRVRHLTGATMPKALLPVAGRPFIDHKLEELRRAGVQRVVMLVGHGAGELRAHVGDGAPYGVAVEYLADGPVRLGTGGAIQRAVPTLGSAFFVTYGDTLLDVSLAALQRGVIGGEGDGAMAVLENADRWEVSNVDVADGRVTAYEKPARTGTHRFIDYGFLAFRADAFEDMPPVPFDLSIVIASLVQRRSLLAVQVEHRFYDVGNEAALRATESYLWQREPDDRLRP